MNKLTIPVILVATVMVAGIFAFMPVQQATTVHTTIIAEVDDILELRSIANTDLTGYDAAKELTIEGAAGVQFQILAIYLEPGTGGDPLDATDDTSFDAIDIDGVTIDGFAAVASVDLSADGYELIDLMIDATVALVGNDFDFEVGTLVAGPGAGESLSVTVKILINHGAADPTIALETT